MHKAATTDDLHMEWLGEKFISTALSLTIIGYVIAAKVSEARFRRTAIPVTGTVVKRFPRQHYTSYYIAYHRDEVRQVAEYCGPPARILFNEGESVEILIDPRSPPNTTVPSQVSSSGSASGNCSLPNEPLFQLWDFVYFTAAVGLLAYTYWS